ncbi:hypothetical protein CAPTEDRAFT_186437 [Capitella teleta]|uniref:G-protein coupled receptors family 1 profile domain-containing protein n=1 Tax=Capitella teleta TaxID=283909 RepID=R7VEA0_CAPTE|nr:hypothetical protein CAPTEDRAFT_186437 [Capitella teleta]|eukprot:ELU17158.1 hypothetical protein CAPTEDRAFT_186437 [Capitella teleta]
MTNAVPSESYYDYGLEDGFYYDSYYEEPIEYTIADNLSLYVSPILLVVAIVGNTVSVLVMCHFGFSTLSPCLYLAILAFVDLLLLLIRVGNVWAKSIWNHDLTEIILIQSNVSCQAPLCWAAH